jgi:DNA-binding SARP family transcriptional activator
MPPKSSIAMPAPLRLTLLGGFELVSAAGPLVFPTRKADAVIAYLALPRGRHHSRDALATLLWGDSEIDQARLNFRQCLFQIRKTLGELADHVLAREGETVALNRAAVAVDVALFERLVNRATPEALTRAVALYRGDLLADLSVTEGPFEEWLLAERGRLREQALDAMTRLLAYQRKRGDVEAAIQLAVTLLTLDPLQEGVHRTLMRLYAEQGRHATALKQYQICVDVLARELGTESEVETRQLYEALSQRRRDEGSAPAILVVEDETVTATVLEGLLRDAAYEVTTARDGAEALRQLGLRRFDLIVSDIAMPTLDGMRLLEIMNQRNIDTPIVFLTGLSGADAEVEGLRLGAADYIRKPINREVLLARVKNVLGRLGRT